MSRIGRGVAPATAGELVQGTIDGQDFLITSPINLFSHTTAEVFHRREIQVLPKGDYLKVEQAVRKLLDVFDSGLGARIQFHSSIPRGKGLASSTSEMLAAMRAVLKASGSQATPIQLARIATEVESSDALFFPGVVRSNPLTGELFESYGPPPPLGFVLVDTGGEVSTAQFDRARAREHAGMNENRLRIAVDLVREGFKKRVPKLIAKGATLSAEIHQGVLYKAPFKELMEGTKEVGALGVNCAHTGTVLGVMFDPRHTSSLRLERRVGEIVGPSAILGTFRLIGSDTRVA